MIVFSESQFKRGRNQSSRRKNDASNNGPVCAAHQTAAVFILIFENVCISEAKLGLEDEEPNNNYYKETIVFNNDNNIRN